MIHSSYFSISGYLEKMNDDTSLHVSDKLAEKPNINVRWYNILFKPISFFLRIFFKNKGYKDGMSGFLIASLGAIYTFALYGKVWEYRVRQEEGKGILPPITNVDLQEFKHRYN